MAATLAILCSGQGGQHRDMFDLLAEVEAAQPVFDQAATVLGEDPREFAKKAPSAELYSNLNGQILCCTQAMAAWAALKDVWPRKVVIGGYSVGELAAWGCGGMFSPEAIIPLAQQRAAVMDEASPKDGGLAGIVGLRRGELEALFDEKPLYTAIVNGVDSYVVGGHRPDLEALCERAQQHGAKRAVLLHVVVPSHTPLLKEATPKLASILKQANPESPTSGYRVLAGIDGATIWSAEEGIEKLSCQVSTTINWNACMESCKSAGAVAALELGPGASLAHMASEFFPGNNARSVGDFKSLAGVEEWIKRMVV